MPNLNRGSKTYRNLKDAFGIESEASCRYLYFARQADIEGYPDVGGLFRDRAEAEMDHAHGHLDYVKAVAIRPPRVPSGAPQRTWGPRSPRRPTRTARCIRAWLASRATRATPTSPNGSRHSPRPKSPTRDASRKRSTGSPSCERAIEGGRRWLRSPSG